MKELTAAIKRLASEELARANEKFPPFNSKHEGMAILFEEVEEAKSEMERVQAFCGSLWEFIKIDSPNSQMVVNLIKEYSALLAAEATQCTAMAMKFEELLERIGEKQ